MTSPTNQDQNTEIVSKESISRDKMESLIGKDQCTEPHLVQNYVEICQSNVEVKPTKVQVSNQPQLDVRTNCLINTTVQNDTALQEIEKDPTKKPSEHVLQPVDCSQYSVEMVIPDESFTKSTEKGDVPSESKVKEVSYCYADTTTMPIGHTNAAGSESDPNGVTDKATKTPNQISNIKTNESPKPFGERHQMTTTMSHRETEQAPYMMVG